MQCEIDLSEIEPITFLFRGRITCTIFAFRIANLILATLLGWEIWSDAQRRTLSTIKFVIKDYKTAFAKYHGGDWNIISMSKYMFTKEGIPMAQFINTIKHEIAHAAVGVSNGHNKVWKAAFMRIGGDGRRCGVGKLFVDAPYKLQCVKFKANSKCYDEKRFIMPGTDFVQNSRCPSCKSKLIVVAGAE